VIAKAGGFLLGKKPALNADYAMLIAERCIRDSLLDSNIANL
jgi:hypothetical protein